MVCPLMALEMGPYAATSVCGPTPHSPQGSKRQALSWVTTGGVELWGVCTESLSCVWCCSRNHQEVDNSYNNKMTFADGMPGKADRTLETLYTTHFNVLAHTLGGQQWRSAPGPLLPPSTVGETKAPGNVCPGSKCYPTPNLRSWA